MSPRPRPRLSASAEAARFLLTVTMVVSTLTISAAAGYLSWLATRDLATNVGWSPHTAWLIMPIVELFFFAGTAEVAFRMWEGRSDLLYPQALIVGALSMSLVFNVIDHVLGAGGSAGWKLLLTGLLAALVPLAQILALHLLIGRVRAFGEQTTTGRPARPAEPQQQTTPRKPAAAAGQRTSPPRKAPGPAPPGDSPRHAYRRPAAEQPQPGTPAESAQSRQGQQGQRAAAGLHVLDGGAASAAERDPQREEAYQRYAQQLDDGQPRTSTTDLARVLGVHPGTARNMRLKWDQRYCRERGARIDDRGYATGRDDAPSTDESNPADAAL